MQNDPYFINKRGRARSMKKLNWGTPEMTQLINWCAPAIDGCPNCKHKRNGVYCIPEEARTPLMHKDGGSGYYRCEEFEFDGNIEQED